MIVACPALCFACLRGRGLYGDHHSGSTHHARATRVVWGTSFSLVDGATIGSLISDFSLASDLGSGHDSSVTDYD